MAAGLGVPKYARQEVSHWDEAGWDLPTETPESPHDETQDPGHGRDPASTRGRLCLRSKAASRGRGLSEPGVRIAAQL